MTVSIFDSIICLVPIAIRNSVFLKEDGTLILMLKTRSVDVHKEPDLVFSEAISRIASGGLKVTVSAWLSPYHHDHAAIICIKS
ncbi:MAG: fibrillarin-like rRNA/tRNA 2'-O-methyltransferase [Methanoregulaceae archaeon]